MTNIKTILHHLDIMFIKILDVFYTIEDLKWDDFE